MRVEARCLAGVALDGQCPTCGATVTAIPAEGFARRLGITEEALRFAELFAACEKSIQRTEGWIVRCPRCDDPVFLGSGLSGPP